MPSRPSRTAAAARDCSPLAPSSWPVCCSPSARSRCSCPLRRMRPKLRSPAGRSTQRPACRSSSRRRRRPRRCRRSRRCRLTPFSPLRPPSRWFCRASLRYRLRARCHRRRPTPTIPAHAEADSHAKQRSRPRRTARLRTARSTLRDHRLRQRAIFRPDLTRLVHPPGDHPAVHRQGQRDTVLNRAAGRDAAAGRTARRLVSDTCAADECNDKTRTFTPPHFIDDGSTLSYEFTCVDNPGTPEFDECTARRRRDDRNPVRGRARDLKDGCPRYFGRNRAGGGLGLYSCNSAELQHGRGPSQWGTEVICLNCGRPNPSGTALCSRCRQRRPGLERARGGVIYQRTRETARVDQPGSGDPGRRRAASGWTDLCRRHARRVHATGQRHAADQRRSGPARSNLSRSRSSSRRRPHLRRRRHPHPPRRSRRGSRPARRHLARSRLFHHSA